LLVSLVGTPVTTERTKEAMELHTMVAKKKDGGMKTNTTEESIITKFKSQLWVAQTAHQRLLMLKEKKVSVCLEA
jgi:hypothetical protein